MKTTIIIPTYKPKEYILECLDSIFWQTYPASEFETIIVLNGCNEPYKSQLDEYIASHAPEGSNTHLIQTDTPGVSNARNVAIDAAKGDYIIFLDADDFISPTYVEGLMSVAQEDSLASARLSIFDDKTKEEVHTNITESFRIAKEESRQQPLTQYKARRLLSTITGKAIPRRIIGNYRFNTNFSLGEDSLFLTRLTKYIKHIPLAPDDCVYNVRKREDSASRKRISTSKQVWNAVSLAWEYTKMYLSDIRHNDFLFYMSRIVASLLKAISKKYRAA